MNITTKLATAGLSFVLAVGVLALPGSAQDYRTGRDYRNGQDYKNHRNQYNKNNRINSWQPQNIRGKWRNINWKAGSNSQHQADIRYNLNAGITTANTLLATGINAGQISAAEEIQCRSELDRLSNEMNRMSRGGYTSAEYQNLSAAFANLNNLITAAGTNGVNR